MRDLETFKRHTLYKLIVMYLAIFLPIVLVTTLESFLNNNLKVDSMWYRYLAFGFFELAIIYKIVHYHLILASPKYRDMILVRLNDERISFIKMKSLNLCFKIVLFINAVGLVVAGFFNEIAFYGLLAEIFVMIITYLATRIYFSKKI